MNWLNREIYAKIIHMISIQLQHILGCIYM